MSEQQFLNRARTIHKKIVQLLDDSKWPEEWSEEEAESIAVLLDDAKWKIHDVAYPA